MVFFIVDNEFNDLQRFHPRWNTPDSCTFDHAIDYAAKFNTREDAEQVLSMWRDHTEFAGRVIDRAEAEKISA